jgi:hypothetical protein
MNRFSVAAVHVSPQRERRARPHPQSSAEAKRPSASCVTAALDDDFTTASLMGSRQGANVGTQVLCGLRQREVRLASIDSRLTPGIGACEVSDLDTLEGAVPSRLL